MTETIRYSLLGKEDMFLTPRDGRFEVTLADGRTVVLTALDVAYLLSDQHASSSIPGDLAVGQMYRRTDGVRGLWSINQAGRSYPLNGGVVDAREFGCVADGITDDTEAMQAALAQAIAIGGTLRLPSEGLCLISSRLDVTGPCVIEGSGWNSGLILKPGSRVIAILVRSSTGSSLNPVSAGVTLRNFKVDGNLGGQLDAGLVQINTADSFLIDHLWVTRGGKPSESGSQGVGGISVSGGDPTTFFARGVIRDCLSELNTKPGILASSYSSDLLIIGNICRLNSGNGSAPGIAMTSCRRIKVIGNSSYSNEGVGIAFASNAVVPTLQQDQSIIGFNTVYGNGQNTGGDGSGIYVVDSVGNTNQKLLVIGNHSHSNGSAGAAHSSGILIQDSKFVTTSGNQCSLNRESGIAYLRSTDCSSHGDVCMNNRQGGGAVHSGIIIDSSSRINLYNPECYDTQGVQATQSYGVYFNNGSSTPSDCTVFGGRLYTNATGTVSWAVLPTTVRFHGVQRSATQGFEIMHANQALLPDFSVDANGDVTFGGEVTFDDDLIVPGIAIGGTDTIRGVLKGEAVWNPDPLPSHLDSTSTQLSVPGAVVGDPVVASHTAIGSLAVNLTAHVSSASTVQATLLNLSGGSIDVAAGTLRVAVIKFA